MTSPTPDRTPDNDELDALVRDIMQVPYSKHKAKSAINAYILAETLKLIGPDKPHNGYCENDYGCFDDAQREFRAKATARFGDSRKADV